MSEKKKPKDGRAAKGKYHKWLEPENLILVQGWRRDGLSDKQVAHNIGINQATLYDWLKKYDKFSEAYKKGTEVAIYEVENALYKSALGYDVQEAEKVTTSHPDGSMTEQKRIKQRHIPPNIGAICFILKNRRPEKWRDRQDILIDSRKDGRLADLIDGLKEDNDDIYTETTAADETLADEQP